MATISTMAMLKPKTFTLLNSLHNPSSARTPTATATATATATTTTLKPINVSLPSLQNRNVLSNSTVSPSSAAIAGAIFSTLSAADAAFAAQQIADLAEGGDNRGLALLIPIVPAILWVLYNILQPALNQLNRMRSEKGFAVGLGLGLGLGLGGGLAAAGLVYSTPSASAAEELATMAAAAAAAEGSGDSRGLLLLFVVAPAIAWVLFNILQPALNQINRMRSG